MNDHESYHVMIDDQPTDFDQAVNEPIEEEPMNINDTSFITQ